MPQCHKCENGEHIPNTSNLRHTSSSATAEWDVDIPDDPAVEGTVPAAPESKGRIVVRHTANDVFGRVDAIDKGPEAEEAPWKE